MPPLIHGDFLVATLFQVGPTLIGAMGSAPLTFGEIESWQRVTGARLTGWEAAALHALSVEYLAESQAATKREAPAPWQPPDARPQVTELQARMRALANL